MPGATTLDDGPVSGEHVRARLASDPAAPRFRAPKVREDSVRRAELLRHLEDEPARPLILLTAPAGYGKTTLLAQWAQESGRPVAWATLDELDADPDVLADSIREALAAIGTGPGRGRSFVLVLDDAHLVPADVLQDAVFGVLDWLPEGSQLALTSRCEPALAIGRMRAQRMLVEVNAADLSMSAAEAASLLRKSGRDLEFSGVQWLVRRTEGWPALLELAAISWSQRADPAEPRPQPRGDDHLISEYFRAEILAPLSAAAVRFLMRSSVLDRLSGPLCDEMLGRKRSGTVLAELARANVPLQPVDASHEWHRLHAMFREMLQTELRRTEPEIQPTLHSRAAEWHRRAGDMDRAIDHARSADDLDRAADLLWAHLPGYLREGRNDMVRRWLTGVTAERVAGHAHLSLVAAHSNLASGNIAAAEQWARSAAVSLSGTPEASTKPERACVLIIQAWAARSGARAMGDDAAQAYQLLEDDSPWRASCCFLAGSAALLIGEEAEAERRLEEGAACGSILAPDAAALCLAQLAVLALQRDDVDGASDFARRACRVVQEHGLSQYPIAALVFAASGAAEACAGCVDEASSALSHCLGLLDRLDDPLAWYSAETRILLARVSLALGDVAGTRELLANASRLARRTADVVVFRRWFDYAWSQFDARAETALAGISKLTTAELRVLRFLPTHYSFHEIAQRLHVSSNTVKTHVHAVYRKLDASSRSEAVAQATQAGLLGG
jgi:LuxR family transcriptional regulator, maltose regulon positive regulatory protein